MFLSKYDYKELEKTFKNKSPLNIYFKSFYLFILFNIVLLLISCYIPIVINLVK